MTQAIIGSLNNTEASIPNTQRFMLLQRGRLLLGTSSYCLDAIKRRGVSGPL